MVKTKEIITVLEILKQTKEPTMLEEYNHLTPYQLLIMTLLSARAKDATLIPVALNLFKTNSTPQEMLKLNQEQLKNKIKKIGFHNTKAKHILQLSEILISKYNGIVPNNLEQLISLPGIGRKTANCILSYVFNIPAIAVDIHVHRITNKTRLNWINTKNEKQSEQELMKIVPKERWSEVNSLIVDHGQRICAPLKPKCQYCQITKFCTYSK